MLKVMFVCSAGMSTSLLVEKVKRAAQEKGVEMDLNAVGEIDAKKKLADTDVLLLGPQVRYLESKFRKEIETIGKDIKLGVVDMMVYGSLNGEKVLQQILELTAK